jgi:hypothetical protein
VTWPSTQQGNNDDLLGFHVRPPLPGGVLDHLPLQHGSCPRDAAAWLLEQTMVTDNKTEEMLPALLELARKHGADGLFEDGAAHEVGDLQGMLRDAWILLTPEQRSGIFRTWAEELEFYR